jgi:ubiquinone/menaquinone biosynthesis C-methylase UbiE
MNTMEQNYRAMWEDIGADSGESYLDVKFKPTYRIGLTHHLRENKIYEFLNPGRLDTVLDIACASGRQLFQICHQIKQGHGVDISKAFLAKAKERTQKRAIRNLDFQEGVIENIPFADGYFDKVICAEVLEHVFDKDVALSEVRRVLRPGGILVISVPNLNADGTWRGRWLRFLGIRKFVPLENFSQKELSHHGDSHVREFTAKSLTDWLNLKGFAVEKVTTVSFVDGPFVDWLLKVPLHLSGLRRVIITFEKWLSKRGLSYGRHLVIRSRRLT